MSRYYSGFPPYVPVAERRAKAAQAMAKLAKKGQSIKPVRIEGRAIAKTFWGKAWCDNLESYSDFENRLPRGRSYVRNGSVVHLEIAKGQILARVSGSEMYTVQVSLAAAAANRWKTLCKQCAGGIGSVVELLQGRFSGEVMRVITHRQNGLFPSPAEIKMKCSCPDWATMCKHVAATLYGVGARLDENPELLFLLRSVDHLEMVSEAAGAVELMAQTRGGAGELSESELGSVFGIELETKPADSATDSTTSTKSKAVRKSAPKTGKKRTKEKASIGKRTPATTRKPSRLTKAKRTVPNKAYR